MSEQKFIWLTDFFEVELILKISTIISVKAIKKSNNSEIFYFAGDETKRVAVTQTVQEILKYIEPKWFPKGYKTVAVETKSEDVGLVCSSCDHVWNDGISGCPKCGAS